MAQNNQQIQLAKQAEQAVRAKRAVTAQQAERAKQASRAIRIDELKYLRQQNPQVETFLANYNDPTELNSFIDALTNREAVSKKFGETWGTISTASGTVAVLSFAGALITQAVGALLAPVTGGASALAAHIVTPVLTKVGAVAAIPSIPAQLDVLYNTGIKPIVSGKPKEAAINTLINIGETMDFVTNPIKGLLHEGGEGFAKATGLAEGGRVNYDFDTGSIVADILLEIVIDPMNWLDLGVGIKLAHTSTKIAKRAVKDVAQEMVATVNTTFAKTLGEITVDGTERITKKLEQTAASEARKLARLSYKDLTEDSKKYFISHTRVNLQQALIQAIRKELPNLQASEIYTILKQTGRDVTTKRFTQSAYNKIQNITWDTLVTDVIKGLAGVQHYSDTFQKFMTKGAMLTSGYGLGVEAAISGWKGVKRWANQFTISKLRSLTDFTDLSGIDLKRWEETKAIWAASEQYTTIISGVAAQRTMDTFYTAAAELFSRDRTLIAQVLQNNTSPIKLANELDALIKNIHGYTFVDYLKIITRINTLEDDLYVNYLEYLQNIYKTLQTDAFTKPLGVKIEKGSKLFTPISKEQKLHIKQLQNISKNTKLDFSAINTILTIKHNDAAITQEILTDPVVSDLFTDIATEERLGALFKKINNDLNALDSEIAPQIYLAIQDIIQTVSSLKHTQELYDNIAKLPISIDIKGVTSKDFKRYIVDQIYGIKGPIDTLLLEFEGVTMPALKVGIETILAGTGFKFKDYPVLEYQIADVYKSFLKAQQDIGIINAENTIPESFIKSVKTLTTKEYLPDYASELKELDTVAEHIQQLKKSIQTRNASLLRRVVTDQDTILNITNTRHLSDLGYALDTVLLVDNLKFFKIFDKFSPKKQAYVLRSMQQVGTLINKYMQIIQQYRPEYAVKVDTRFIKLGYNEFKKVFLNPKTRIKMRYIWPAIPFLRYTTDTVEQIAQLIVFSQMPKSKELQQEFSGILSILPDRIRLDILYPNRLTTTPFAWAPLEQISWLTKKQFNKNVINWNKVYQDLDTPIKNYLQDFLSIRQMLSVNKLDRPKVLQNERYIKLTRKYYTLFNYLKEYFDTLFDKELAKKEIEDVQEIFLKYPDFADSGVGFTNRKLVTQLAEYWEGTREFKQADKEQAMLYTRTRHHLEYLVHKQKITREEAQARLQILKDQGIVDEFTEFWEHFQDFNKSYAHYQALEVTKDAIKNILPKKVYAQWFVTYPEIGAQLFRILTDTHLTEYTNADYELYTTFIKHYAEYIDPTQDLFIPYNLLPAGFKKVVNKYYYDVFGIADTTLVYRAAAAVKSSTVAGWFAPMDNSIYAVLNIKRHSLTEDNAFVLLNTTLRHETGHNILHFVIRGEEYDQFMQDFKEKFIKTFGETVYDGVLNAITKAYSAFSYYTDTAIKEEVFTYSLGNQLNAFRVVVPELAEIPETVKQEFSDSLIQHLARIVQIKSMFINGGLTKSFEEYIRNRGAALPYTQIKQITPWDPIKKQQELNNALDKATTADATQVLYNLFELSPEEFLFRIARSFRFITFQESDLMAPRLKGLFKKFNKTLPEGVHLIHDVSAHRYWYVLDATRNVDSSGHQICLDGKLIPYIQTTRQFNTFKIIDEYITDSKNPGITKHLNELDKDIQLLTGAKLGDSQGEILSKETLYLIYGQMPEQVRKLLPPIEEWLDDSYFQVTRFNESVLGAASSKRKLGMFSSNQIVNMRNTITGVLLHTKAKNEFINSVFDSILSLSSPNSVWQGLSNEDLLEALQITPNYKLTTLVYDKKYGLKVRAILPTSVDVIAKVKETGGWILPLQIYKDMVNTINHRVGSEGFLKLWSRLIYLLKAGYLMMPGAWIRNFIDTNIKSLLGMESQTAEYLQEAKYILSDVNELQKSLLKAEEERKKKAWEEYGALATKLLNEKDSIDKYILAKSKEGYIQTEEIQKWFAEGNAKYLTYEAYKELESDFLSQGIAGNVMRDLYATEGGGAWRTITQMTGNIVEFGNKIENYTRLADYLYHLDHGADYTSALAKLAKTHFDYSFKSEAEQYAELLFPFATFSFRNFSYWVEQVEKHPWIMRNYAHLMAPHWDFKDYTPEELALNYRVQNQIIYGQLKIAEFNDKLIAFKANPSIQDAIQMFSDPINNIYARLAAPLAYPIDLVTDAYTNPINLIPIAGPIIQNVQTATRTGSPAPSILSVQPTPRRTGLSERYSLSGTDKYTDSTYRTPKYRNNVVYDHYAKKGISRYRLNMYPIIDIAHDVKMRHTTNVYNRIKNRVKTDVYKGVRYRMRLDVNRFR